MNVKDRSQSPATAPAQLAPRWEYRSKKMDVEADLTQYGQDGWELVAVVNIPHDPGQAVYHFKRRRF